MRLIFLSLPAIVLLAACKEEKPAPAPMPAPKACFTPARQLLDSGETVLFSNCSTNAESYEWSVDGRKFKDKDLLTEFHSHGLHTLRLKATGRGGADSTQMDIIVGRRKIVAFNILRFPPLAPNGQAWDADGSAPDLQVIFGPNGNPDEFVTETLKDAAAPALLAAKGNAIVRHEGVDINNSHWSFRLVDKYGSAETIMWRMPGGELFYPGRGKGLSQLLVDEGGYRIEIQMELVP